MAIVASRSEGNGKEILQLYGTILLIKYRVLEVARYDSFEDNNAVFTDRVTIILIWDTLRSVIRK